MLGAVNESGALDGNDVIGFVRAKLGGPDPGEHPACADYGVGDLTFDTALFVGNLLGGQG